MFLWIPWDSLQNAEELPGISDAILLISESVFLHAVSLDGKMSVTA